MARGEGEGETNGQEIPQFHSLMSFWAIWCVIFRVTQLNRNTILFDFINNKNIFVKWLTVNVKYYIYKAFWCVGLFFYKISQ